MSREKDLRQRVKVLEARIDANPDLADKLAAMKTELAKVEGVYAVPYMAYSTKKQSEGTSEQRQEGDFASWCRREGIKPWKEVYWDKGRSRYHGKHREHDFGRLLRDVAAHKFPKGSVVWFEDMDRFSRQELHQVLSDWRAITCNGCKIHVGSLGQTFDATNTDNDMMGVIYKAIWAREQSLKLSKRLRDKWRIRREQRAATGKGVLSGRLPSWIQIVDGKPALIPEKTAIVRRVLLMLRKGYGYQSVAKTLNREGVPPIGKSRFWHASYIEKLAHNRAIIGEYQPRVMDMEKGLRVPVGGVIADYFPAVETVENFRLTHQAIASRLLQRGSVTHKVSNLFTALAYESGERMAYRIKNHVGYLQTAQELSQGVRYDHFERVALHWLREIRLNLNDADEYAGLEARANDLQQRVKTMTARIDTDPDLSDLLDKLSAMKRELREVEEKIETCSVLPLQGQILHSQRLARFLAEAPEGERQERRRELRQDIRFLISRLDVAIKGEKRKAKRVTVTATFRDGQARQFFYETRAGRLVRSGMYVDERIFGDGFPCDDDPAEAERENCRTLRAEGLQIKEIASRLGLHRVTVYRYLKSRKPASRKPQAKKVG